jgi:hypothetical protein
MQAIYFLQIMMWLHMLPPPSIQSLKVPTQRNQYFTYSSTFLEWLELNHHDPFLDALDPFSHNHIISTSSNALFMH